MAYNWLGYTGGGVALPVASKDEKQPNESWAAWLKRKQALDDEDEKRAIQHEVLKAQKAEFEGNKKEVDKMKAWDLNGRPQGAETLGLNDPRSGGAMIANQQAYDRNRAALNSPGAMNDLLTRGVANVGAPMGHMVGGRAPSLEDDQRSLAQEQAGKDVERGAIPDANTQKLIPAGNVELWQKIADLLQQRKQAMNSQPQVLGSTQQEPLRGRVYDVPGYLI